MEVQNNFRKANTIYKIVRDIDLEGGTLTIPNECIIDFQGGTIYNGTLVLNNTKIIPNGSNILDYITASISGTYKEGLLLYDSSIKKLKLWNGSEWTNVDGTSL